MGAERSSIINGTKISEYWWAGKFVVYINDRASELSFEDACESAKNTEQTNQPDAVAQVNSMLYGLSQGNVTKRYLDLMQ